jgi:short-subunit dehydrogenase
MADAFLQTYGPVALVTGASSGIGRAFAENLAARGFDLVLVARRVERLEKLAEQFSKQHGTRTKTWPIDLADKNAAAKILQATAGLDVGLVVSNAGFGLRGEHASHAPADLSEMLMVNCHTPMLLAQGFIPRLQARGKGAIVFISSVEALLGVPYSAGYSATKGFTNRFGEAIWGELTPGGIDVLTVCPGATDTEALTRAGMDAKTAPNVMSPDEVARLALENITNGPVYLPSPHYRQMFDQLLAMPRRDALAAMAGSYKK